MYSIVKFTFAKGQFLNSSKDQACFRDYNAQSFLLPYQNQAPSFLIQGNSLVQGSME